MNVRTIAALMRKEFLQVFRDPPTVVQIFLIPLIQLVVLANAATFDTGATRLLVRDDDRTPASEALVAALIGSGEFTVVGTAIDPARIEQVLRRREAAAVLQIPVGYEAAVARGTPTAVQLQINAEEGAVAGLIQQAAQRIVERRAGAPTTLELRQRGWFNPTRRYKDWMVPGILVSLTTIIGLLLTAQSITREKELGTLEQLNVTPVTRGEFITAKLLPFWLIAMGIFTVGLTWRSVLRDSHGGGGADRLPRGDGVPHRGAGDRAVDFDGHADAAAGDVRRLLRAADLPAHERTLHAARGDARLGAGGGACESGDAFRRADAGRPRARGGTRGGRTDDSWARGGRGRGAWSGGDADPQDDGVGRDWRLAKREVQGER